MSKCDIVLVDINECNSSPCENGAICTDTINSYTCDCVEGHTGANCETGECMGLSYSFRHVIVNSGHAQFGT